LLEIPAHSSKTLRLLAEQKEISISVKHNNNKKFSAEECIFLEGNQTYLQNAFNNLLKNAIEASPRGGQVKIRIDESETHLSVSIHNWGAIPEEVRPIFFEKYATSGKRDGLGLGTYMANLVVKAHDGQMNFTSSEENGTEVLMILPKNEAHL
jgi:signal transduction histidine kinase